MIPLTVIGGYLGAGKTTILNKLLNTNHDQRIAVLVNDFGAVNIDAALIINQHGPVLELTNGCVCCSVQDDLGAALEAVRDMNVDHAIIEASGVALPAKIADYGHTWPGYRLSGTLVAVDASRIAQQRRDKFVGRLVDDQISQGDLLLVTKLDLISATDARALLTSLPRPGIKVAHGELPLEVVMGLEPSTQMTGEPTGSPPHFHTCVLSTEEERSVQAMATLLDCLPPAVVRVKGWFKGDGASWLVQGVGDRRTIEPFDNGERDPATQLVFISVAEQLESDVIESLFQ